MASRRRGGNPSGVRGPNSALTEFLRSRGINANEIRRRAEERARQSAPTTSPNEASAVDAAEAAQEAAATVTVAATRPTAASSSSKKKTKKRKKAADSDDEDWSLPKANIPNPGQISFCVECNCRFTVTAYSRPVDDEGFLCNPCGSKNAKEQKEQRKKRNVRRRVKRDQARLLLDGERGGPKKLSELCIGIVAKYIDHVEALGDIGTMNMDRICQIISRNRSLNSSTLKLFVEPGSTRLTLYDCSKIDASELQSIARFVPTLQHLSLRFCGRITDDVLDYYSDRLTSLKSLELWGPFLITKACYQRFFEALGPNLESFSISDSLRFDIDVIAALVENCPNLTEVRLRNIGRLDDTCVRFLKGCSKLQVLEISAPSLDITDQSIGEVLNAVGSGLKELNLSGCVAITDETTENIHACCGRLQSLNLEECELITDSGIKNLFRNWSKNPGLSRLNLGRVIELQGTGLLEALGHSGKTLEYLNINSCNLLDESALEAFVKKAEEMVRLEELDVGFVRAVDDGFVEGVGKRCVALEVVKVWGVPRVTATCGVEVLIVGREADVLA